MPNEKPISREPELRRLHMLIAYDGTNFAGWQSQKNGDAIQDRLETAIAKVTGERTRVHAAGRTDAGVHALGQSAHLDLRSCRLPPAVLADALNASLPPEIRVMKCKKVPAKFHARFDARGKVYRYRLVTGRVLPPFERFRAWHVVQPLDEKMLRACANEFVGRHDFGGYAANRGHPVESTVRTIRKTRVQRRSGVIVVEFDGDGFLYKMVRLMVGEMVRCATGKSNISALRARLHRRPTAQVRLVAPAHGLTLVRVRY